MRDADCKVLNWMLRGSVEYNKIAREMDIGMLEEAISFEYKDLLLNVKDYFSRYKTPPSYELLYEELIEDLDTLSILDDVQEASVEESEVLFYLNKIRESYNFRLARKVVNSLSDENQVSIDDFNKLLSKTNSKIDRIYRTSTFSEGDVRDSTDDRWNRYLKVEEDPTLATGILSGYSEIDDMIGGIRNSEMMIISGASSSGKSLLMMNFAINAWLGSNNFETGARKDDGVNVLYFTLEMTKEQIEQRMDANIASIRHKALKKGVLSDEEKLRYRSSLEFQKSYDKRFYVCDLPRGSTANDLEARYDAILSEFKPDLVVVDYLGIMNSNKKYDSDWLDVGHVAADLHEFCRTKDVAVLTAAQRKTKDKKSKKQSQDVEELGRSKMIGDNATMVLLIESREDEILKDDMVIHVVKNRDGEKGTIKLLKEFDKSKVRDMPINWVSDMGQENALG